MGRIKFLFFAGMMMLNLKTFAGLNEDAAKALIRRVVPEAADRFEVAEIPQENGKDVFEVESSGGRIILRGSSGVSVASALHYYLKEYCHCSITWNGTNLQLPDPLPAVEKKVHKVTPYTYRYYINYCTFNYTMAWWNWDRWQREIDWMAMNGINMPLALTGEEAVWQEVYKELGFSDEDLKSFFSGPAYFAWLWMGNLDGWGGPLPQHWIDTHKALQKKILAQERALGMKPVLPAFTGHVPPSFRKKFPQARLKKTNWGVGFNDVYILDPEDPLFETIGRKFIEAQTREYGTDHLYSADTFNENVPPTNDSTFLDAMSKKVYHSMALADPEAVWVMQGWMFSYNARFWHAPQIRALLNAVPDDHVIVLDLWSESHPVWNRTEGYYGKPWIWNMLHNFGGNISLFGRMRHVASDPAMALHDPESGNMVGIGLTPEAIEQNPALYELMADNIWRSDIIDLNDWLPAYARRRYGAADDSINEAWKILENTVYSGGITEGGPESIVAGRPTFEKNTAWVNTGLTYDPKALLRAWDLFIQAADRLGGSDGFRYDLVDLTRQVLANYATPLQQKFSAAFRRKDVKSFNQYSRQFLELIDDMDELLATRSDFLLGSWLADARSWGVTEAEKDIYEFNARDLITLWGGKNCPLHEYACRQWSGLLKGFYRPRWNAFFQYAGKCLAGRRDVDMRSFDAQIREWEWKWVNSHEEYPTAAKGDAVAAAKALYQKYRKTIEASYH
ncbi:alpha-N-acetylglucosaminidase [Compostibacter hankyongensis]